jgi:hypothetical protein
MKNIILLLVLLISCSQLETQSIEWNQIVGKTYIRQENPNSTYSKEVLFRFGNDSLFMHEKLLHDVDSSYVLNIEYSKGRLLNTFNYNNKLYFKWSAIRSNDSTFTDLYEPEGIQEWIILELNNDILIMGTHGSYWEFMEKEYE